MRKNYITSLFETILGFAPITLTVSAIIAVISAAIYGFSMIPYCQQSEHSYDYCIKYEVNVSGSALIGKAILFFIIAFVVINAIIIIGGYIRYYKEKNKTNDEDDEVVEEKTFSCGGCGAIVLEEDNVCQNCGASFDEDEENDKTAMVNAMYEKKKKENINTTPEKDLNELKKRLQKEQEERKKVKELKEKLQKEQDERKKFNQIADDLIIECEGNIFKATKLFKEQFNVSNEIAKEHILKAQKRFKGDDEKEKVIENKPLKEDTTMSSTGIPKCPTCGSTNVDKMDMIGKLVSTELFGLASGSIGKTFKCKACGYKW